MLFASEMAGRYALAALSSVDRAEKKWSNRPSAQNPDYLNVVAALARLEQSGSVAANARVYLVGMSQGCGFVSLLSQLLRLHASRPPSAQLMACCTGFDQLFDPEYEWSPTVFQAMSNDELINNTDTAAHAAYLRRAGVRTEMYTVQPQAVDACVHNLCRIPGVPPGLPTALRSALLAAPGLLDAGGRLAQDPRDPAGSAAYDAVLAAIPGAAAFAGTIQAELAHLYASHEFSADHSADATATGLALRVLISC